MRFAFRKPVDKRKRQAGFTVIEMMAVSVMVFILGGLIVMAVQNLPAITASGGLKHNAKVLTTLIQAVETEGGTVGAGAGNDVDTTTMQTIIDSFAPPGVTVTNAYTGLPAGPFKVADPSSFTAASYSYANGIVSVVSGATAP